MRQLKIFSVLFILSTVIPLSDTTHACEITVFSPSSTSVWYYNVSRNIFLSPNTCDGLIRLDLYKGSEFLITLTESASGQIWEWNPLDDAGRGTASDYRIKATCLTDTTCNDFGDYFTIIMPDQPTDLIPAKGETFLVGLPVEYCWTLPDVIDPSSVSGYELQFSDTETPDGPWDEAQFIESTCGHAFHGSASDSLYWRVRIVYNNDDRGPWAVSYHQVIQDTPSAHVFWNIVKTGEMGDTVFVHVGMSESPRCGNCGAVTVTSTLQVYPCPLNEACTGGGLIIIEEDGYYSNDLKLLKGLTYTFSGDWYYHGLWDGAGVPCGNDCWESGNIDVRQYPDDYVGTEERSWGAIKSMYKK